jgi:hypothetical protein
MMGLSIVTLIQLMLLHGLRHVGRVAMAEACRGRLLAHVQMTGSQVARSLVP